jgi:hypothetical protein
VNGGGDPSGLVEDGSARLPPMDLPLDGRGKLPPDRLVAWRSTRVENGVVESGILRISTSFERNV